MKSKDPSLLYISFIQTSLTDFPCSFFSFPSYFLTGPFLHVLLYLHIYPRTSHHVFQYMQEWTYIHSFACFLPIFLYYCSKLINFTVTQDQSKVITFLNFPIDSHQVCFRNWKRSKTDMQKKPNYFFPSSSQNQPAKYESDKQNTSSLRGISYRLVCSVQHSATKEPHEDPCALLSQRWALH